MQTFCSSLSGTRTACRTPADEFAGIPGTICLEEASEHRMFGQETFTQLESSYAGNPELIAIVLCSLFVTAVPVHITAFVRLSCDLPQEFVRLSMARPQCQPTCSRTTCMTSRRRSVSLPALSCMWRIVLEWL